jgi:hypothetical protein
MPTVFRKDGIRFFFFSNEGNEPPHIHVEYGSGYAKFWLNPLELEYFSGITQSQLTKLRILVEENQTLFSSAWYAYFNRNKS